MSGPRGAGAAAVRGTRSPAVRAVLRRVAIWIGWQLVCVAVGRVVGRSLARGDEQSPDIRRVLFMSGTELRPTNPALSRVRLDAVMGGARLDLTGVPPTPDGVDVTVRAVMGGAAILVPVGRTVWWSFRGVLGGLGAAEGIRRASDPASAELRVHASAVMGGVGIETPRT